MARGHKGFVVVVFISCLVAAVVFTWPFAIHPGSTITGPTGDLTGAAGWFQLWVDHHQDPFLPGHMSEVNAPAGRPMPWALNDAGIVSTAPVYALTWLVGGVAAYGILVLLGYALSGASMAALVLRCGGSRAAALLAGAALAICPYMRLRQQWPQLMQLWLLVLLAWALLNLTETPSVRKGLLAGGAASLAALWTPYFVLLAAVVFVFGLAYGGLEWTARRGDLRRFAPGGAAALGPFLAAGLYLWLLGHASLEGSGEILQGTEQLTKSAARPYEYLVPSASNPFVGGAARSFRLRHLHGASSDLVDSTIYVGIVILLLALVGFVVARRRTATGLMLAIVTGGFLASLPPHVTILGVRVEMLSGLIHQYINPSWRIYSRLGANVMIGLCVVAGLGATYLQRRIRNPRTAVGVVALIGIGALLDLWTQPAISSTRIEVPAAYRLLAQLPSGATAEYPLRRADLSLDYWDVFYAHFTHDPIFGGYARNTLDERAKMNLGRLTKTSAIELASYGVRYVVVRPRAPLAPVPPGMPGDGFAPVLTGRDVDLYRVTATGYASADFERGFYGTELWKGLPRRWMTTAGRVELTNPNSNPTTFRFSGLAFAAHTSRTIRVRLGHRELASFGVATSETAWSFVVRLRPGRTELTLVASPPAAELGAADPRRASIYISDFTSQPLTSSAP